MVTQQFLILQAVLQNILIVQQPYNASEVYVCFDNGTKNETWPDNWSKMSQQNGGTMFTASIPDSAKQYKLRVILQNHSSVDSPWKILKEGCSNKTGCQEDLSTLTALTWYITVCISIIVSCVITRCCIQYTKVVNRENFNLHS